MAAAFLEEALAITGDPGAGWWSGGRAAGRAPGPRRPARPGRLPQAQCELVATLEALGDAAAALQVATQPRAEWPAPTDPENGMCWRPR